MRKYLIIAVLYLVYGVIAATASAETGYAQETVQPLDMERLKNELSFVRGKAKAEGPWPRQIRYTFKTYDFKTDQFRQEARTFKLKKSRCG